MDRTRTVCVTLTFLGLLAGCSNPLPDEGPGPGGAAKPEAQCVASEVEISRDEVTELGFSAGDLLLPIEGTFQSVLQYRDGSTTDLTITVAHDGSPFYLRDSTPPPEDPDLECAGKSLEASVLVTFDTDDGAFVASYTKRIGESAPGATSQFLYTDLEVEELQGTWDPGNWSHVSFVVYVGQQGGQAETHGEISSYVQPEDSLAEECGLASWNAPLITGCE